MVGWSYTIFPGPHALCGPAERQTALRATKIRFTHAERGYAPANKKGSV